MLNIAQSVLSDLVTRIWLLAVLCLLVQTQHIAFGSLVWFDKTCNGAIDVLLFVHSSSVAFVL